MQVSQANSAHSATEQVYGCGVLHRNNKLTRCPHCHSTWAYREPMPHHNLHTTEDLTYTELVMLRRVRITCAMCGRELV